MPSLNKRWAIKSAVRSSEAIAARISSKSVENSWMSGRHIARRPAPTKTQTWLLSVKSYDDQKRGWNWRRHKSCSRCSAVSELRKELDELTFADVWTLNRNELIIMLSTISQFLDKILGKTEYTERLEIHLQHEAVGQLNNLIEA